MKKKILVTGADGFIGSHLTESLVEKGFRVKAFTFYNSFNSWGWLDTLDSKIAKEIEIVSGDIRDFDSVKNATKNCDLIFGGWVSYPEVSITETFTSTEIDFLAIFEIISGSLFKLFEAGLRLPFDL